MSEQTDLEMALLRRALRAEDATYRLRLELAAERSVSETLRVLLHEMSERLKAASIGVLTGQATAPTDARTPAGTHAHDPVEQRQ